MNRVLRHTSLLSLSAAATKVLLIVFAVYVTNVLGLAALGRLEYYLNLVFIFVVAADFGLEQWTTRELARRKEEGDALIPNLIALRLPFTAVALVLMALFLRFISRQQSVGFAGLIALTYLLSFSFQTLLRGMMRAYGMMGYESFLNFSERLLTVGAGVLLIHAGYGAQALLGCFLVGNIAVLVATVFLLRGRGLWSWGRVQTAQWSGYVSGASLFGLAAIFITIFYRQDTILLTELKGETATGGYRSAYRLVEGLWLVPQMLSVALYPVLSELFHKGTKLDGICAQAFRLLTAISLPLAVGGTLVAPPLIRMIYPDNPDGIAIFAVLVWTMPFVYGNFLVGTVLAATDRQRVNLIASIVAVLVNLGLNFFAIPRWLGLGAAVVSVVTQAAFFLVMFVPMTRDMKNLGISGSLVRSLICCAAMAIAVGAVRPYGVLVQITLGALVYCLLAWHLQLFSRDDLRQFRRA
ncbi:MAG TPA: flippase [bacterium]|nr:flippase [bacterium]